MTLLRGREEHREAATPPTEPYGLAPPAGLLRGLLRAQLVLASVAGIVAWVAGGSDSGLYALWGGAIAWSGTLLAMAAMFVFGARSALGALGAQMAGEGIKVVWTIAMFWWALTRPDARALPLIVGFCVALLGYIAGPALASRRGR